MRYFDTTLHELLSHTEWEFEEEYDPETRVRVCSSGHIVNLETGAPFYDGADTPLTESGEYPGFEEEAARVGSQTEEV